jgi:DNA (cytosine-5)-methyltransferase 1
MTKGYPPSIGPDAWLDFIRGPRADAASSSKEALSSMDLFSSVGGLSLGLEIAAAECGRRVDHVAAVDIDPEALRVHQVNLKTKHPMEASAGTLVDFAIRGSGINAKFAYPPELLAPFSGAGATVNTIVAGPPCQGHSNLNNKTRRDDPRNALYLAVPAVAVATDAQIVIIENVPEVTAARGELVPTAIALLRAADYDVEFGVVRATDIGWPQTRRRFFVIATKGWAPEPLADVVNSQQSAAQGVGWLLDDLLDRDGADFMDTTPELSETNAARIALLFNEELYDLPNHARPECHRDGTTYGATYGRMRWEAPAPTITTGFGTPGRGRFVHPLRPRVLTAREAARVQGFPDWFRFQRGDGDPTRGQITRWIGNAVPAPLGRIAALAALLDAPASFAGG